MIIVKRYLSLLICLIMCLSFTACKEESKSETVQHPINIVNWVKKGGIPEIELALGDNVDQVRISLASMGVDEHGDPLLQEFASPVNEEKTIMTINTISCVYDTENPENGITYLAYFEGGYGFKSGTTPNKIDEVMKSYGYKATERAAKSGELFFLLGGSSGAYSVMEYTINETTLLFVFSNNGLDGVVIHK